MKKSVLIVILVLILGGGIGVGIWYFLSGGFQPESDEDKISVESVQTLTSSNTGMLNRFIGVVESQELKEINKDANAKIKEVLVEEGDQVKPGTSLFSYDTQEMEWEIQRGNLEMQQMTDEITSMKTQISQLEKEKKSAKNDEIAAYTIQIQKLQNQISKQEYEINVKNSEMVKTQQKIDNATVTSDMNGVIQKINQNALLSDGSAGSTNPDGTAGNSSAFMTILATGDLRVKGTVNEMNLSSLEQGKAVFLHPRTDESITWKGTISKIDTESKQSGNNNGVMTEGNGNENNGQATSSKYNFYVEVAEGADPVLGQHVLIELDAGQLDKLEGIWIPEEYMVREENETPYVWVANAQNRIEKRFLTLGEYNEGQKKYEILEGLLDTDYIAYPFNYIKEGMLALKEGEIEIETESTEENKALEEFGTDPTASAEESTGQESKTSSEESAASSEQDSREETKTSSEEDSKEETKASSEEDSKEETKASSEQETQQTSSAESSSESKESESSAKVPVTTAPVTQTEIEPTAEQTLPPVQSSEVRTISPQNNNQDNKITAPVQTRPIQPPQSWDSPIAKGLVAE